MRGEGRHPPHAVVFEIGGSRITATAPHLIHNGLCERALIKGVRSFFRYLAKRSRQIRLAQERAFGKRFAGYRVDSPEFGVRGTKLLKARLLLLQAVEPTDLEALIRQPDCTRKQFSPRPSPEFAMNRLEPSQQPRNQDGAMTPAVRMADVFSAFIALENTGFHSKGALVAEIDEPGFFLLLTPDERHAAATQPGIERLHHPQGQGDRHRRIAGVSSLFHDAQTRFHRFLMGRRYGEHLGSSHIFSDHNS